MESMYNRFTFRRSSGYYSMLDHGNLFEVGLSDGIMGCKSNHAQIKGEFIGKSFSQDNIDLYVASYREGYLVGMGERKDIIQKFEALGQNYEEPIPITGGTDSKRKVLEFGVGRHM